MTNLNAVLNSTLFCYTKDVCFSQSKTIILLYSIKYPLSKYFKVTFVKTSLTLPACRRLLFPLLHAEKAPFPFPRATKEIGDVYTQATLMRITSTSAYKPWAY